MGRNKLLKFQDNAESFNVIEPGKPHFDTIKGNWRSLQFKNNHPVHMELACGYGEYSVGLGQQYPEINFIGVDIKGARIWRGSQEASRAGLNNVAFLRTKADKLDLVFAENELECIWIIHPDPRPKKKDVRRRLTNPRYLDIYKSILINGGEVRIKTDALGFYEYTLGVLNDRNDVKELQFTPDLANSDLKEDHRGIQTRYETEAISQGNTIKYIKFKFTD